MQVNAQTSKLRNSLLTVLAGVVVLKNYSLNVEKMCFVLSIQEVLGTTIKAYLLVTVF